MKYYVYYLIDPRDNRPFYIGKGSGNRSSVHGLGISNNPRKDAYIFELWANGCAHIVQTVKSFDNESDAYLFEEQKILEYGRRGFEEYGILTNLTLHSRPPSRKGAKMFFTKEHRKKLSEAAKGKPKNYSWNKGLTKETDPRVAKAAKKRSETGNAHQIGQKYSADRVEKVKKALAGREVPDAEKKKMSKAKKGKTWEEIYGVEGARLRREAHRRRKKKPSD